jgi:hypothetical protein
MSPGRHAKVHFGVALAGRIYGWVFKEEERVGNGAGGALLREVALELPYFLIIDLAQPADFAYRPRFVRGRARFRARV